MNAVFFDVDTQIDFLYPAGALYVPGAETILDRLAALNRYAASHGHIVISTMDAHAEDDPEFKLWPHHCVAGTAGQRKPSCTLLEQRLVVPNAPNVFPALTLGATLGAAPSVSEGTGLSGVQQILLEKQTLDCFSNVNLPPLLERLGAERYVVYGVVTEICVRLATLGLLKTGKRVELVTDAVRSLNEDDAARTLAEFTAAGGVLTSVEAVTGVR